MASPGEAAAALAAGDGILLDIREEWEVDLARVPESLHIPMGEVPERLDELPHDRPLYVMCHHGVRSAMITRLLRDAGFKDVHNVTGGIDRWAREVDVSIARY